MVHIPSEQEFGDFAQWQGRSVQGRDGGTIGQAEEIFLDTDTRQPEWVLAALPGGDGLRLVPLADAQVRGDTLTVGYGDELIRSSPRVERSEPVPQERERELYAHYGVEYSHDGSDTGLPSGAEAETAGAATTG